MVCDELIVTRCMQQLRHCVLLSPVHARYLCCISTELLLKLDVQSRSELTALLLMYILTMTRSILKIDISY